MPPAAPKTPAAGRLATGSQRQQLAARYLAIARAGNRRLDAGFGRLQGPDRNRLTAAAADLRDIAATERLFDRRLLQIPFPPGNEIAARTLYRVNESRAWLTLTAAAAASLQQLHDLEPRLTAASKPVEQAVRVIRSQLGLPPPSAS